MHRLLWQCLTVGVLLLVLVTVSGDTQVAVAQGRDMAAGGGTVAGGFIKDSEGASFSFAASSDPDGGNPKGHIFIQDSGFALSFNVECLYVEGNAALIGGSGGFVGGGIIDDFFIQLTVVDWGEPGARADDIGAGTFNGCTSKDVEDEIVKIDSGNIQVRDVE